MGFTKELLGHDGRNDSDVPFAPIARYYPSMDFVIYLKEDCSYRADRVDSFLTVLWHPYEQKLVGVKVKGFAFLFERLKKIITDLEDEHFLPIVKALELAMTDGSAESLMSGIEVKRKAELYEKAIELVDDVKISLEDLPKAA